MTKAIYIHYDTQLCECLSQWYVNACVCADLEYVNKDQ